MDGVRAEEDLLAEGEPEKEFDPGIASRLPRKRVAAGALIRDPDGRILFVVPNYKPGLEIPGGIVNANESPLAACRREVREELGVEIPIGRLLTVDWMPTHGPWTDGLMFIFDGGVLDGVPRPDDGNSRDSEIDGVMFDHLSQVSAKLRPSMRRRLTLAITALESSANAYAEFGRPLPKG